MSKAVEDVPVGVGYGPWDAVGHAWPKTPRDRPVEEPEVVPEEPAGRVRLTELDLKNAESLIRGGLQQPSVDLCLHLFDTISVIREHLTLVQAELTETRATLKQVRADPLSEYTTKGTDQNPYPKPDAPPKSYRCAPAGVAPVGVTIQEAIEAVTKARR